MRNVCLGLLAIIVILLVIRSPSQGINSDLDNEGSLETRKRINRVRYA